jgi:hypothetical protein
MTDPDRVKLQVAAVIGAVLGIVTYYVVGSRWLAVLLCVLIGAVHGPGTCYVVGGGWIGILLFGLIGAVVVSGAVSKLRVFRQCLRLPAAVVCRGIGVTIERRPKFLAPIFGKQLAVSLQRQTHSRPAFSGE